MPDRALCLISVKRLVQYSKLRIDKEIETEVEIIRQLNKMSMKLLVSFS